MSLLLVSDCPRVSERKFIEERNSAPVLKATPSRKVAESGSERECSEGGDCRTSGEAERDVTTARGGDTYGG